MQQKTLLDICIFDLDSTLCPREAPASEGTLERLRNWHDTHKLHLAICSGKPLTYLNGFARQVGLDRLHLIAGNGGELQLGSGFPAIYQEVLADDPEALELMQEIKDYMRQKHPADVWIQDNRTGGAVFPVYPHPERPFRALERCGRMEEALDLLSAEIQERFGARLNCLDLYRHEDCIDFAQRGTDKGRAVQRLLDLLGLSAERAAAVGDGPNDQPMLDAVAYGISIANPQHERIWRRVATIDEALDCLAELL